MASISPLGKYFANIPINERWLFRGLGDDQYDLIPSSLRPDKDEVFALAKLPMSRRDKEICQACAEIGLLQQFLEIVDRNGLPIPEDSLGLRSDLNRLHSDMLGTLWQCEGNEDSVGAILAQYSWPQLKFISLMVLAQHYGVPTRLLDWTRTSKVAAYFAAMDACGKSAKAGARLIVWALAESQLQVRFSFGRTMGEVVVLLVPRSANPNLHAQDGALTLMAGDVFIPAEPIDRRPMTELLAGTSVMHDRHPRFYRFTLPQSKKGELLWYLAKEGVTGAKLFPGYAGAAKELSERLHLQTPDAVRLAAVN